MNKICKYFLIKIIFKLKEVNDFLYIKNKGRKRLRLDILLIVDGCLNFFEIFKNI